MFVYRVWYIDIYTPSNFFYKNQIFFKNKDTKNEW